MLCQFGYGKPIYKLNYIVKNAVNGLNQKPIGNYNQRRKGRIKMKGEKKNEKIKHNSQLIYGYIDDNGPSIRKHIIKALDLNWRSYNNAVGLLFDQNRARKLPDLSDRRQDLIVVLAV